MLVNHHIYSFTVKETEQVFFLHKFSDNTKHYKNKCTNLLNSVLIMFFRLRSRGSCPGAVAVSTCQLCSANPHNQNGTMTNARALQRLYSVKKKQKNSRSKTTQGQQPQFLLLPFLSCWVLPLLATKILLWGRFFSVAALKWLLKGTGSFRICFYETERTPWLDWLQSLWRCFFFSCLVSN